MKKSLFELNEFRDAWVKFVATKRQIEAEAQTATTELLTSLGIEVKDA